MVQLSRKNRISEGPLTQEAYEKILDELANIRMKKVQMYGEWTYNDPDREHCFLAVYMDIHRKFVRLKNYVYVNRMRNSVGESFRDTLLDMANYCLMAVQIWDRFYGQKKEGEPKKPQEENVVPPASNC